MPVAEEVVVRPELDIPDALYVYGAGANKIDRQFHLDLKVVRDAVLEHHGQTRIFIGPVCLEKTGGQLRLALVLRIDDPAEE